MNIELKLGDCLDVLRTIPDNSIDSIVTDPPYGLEFMGKKWDYDVPSVEVWTECLRVLKPGGHLLSFAGSRTYHRMAVRIEDAGFEIRDQIMWVYGSGFPKSHNIGKAIDKIEGKEVPTGKSFNVAGQGIRLNQNRELRSDHPDYVKHEYQNEWNGWGTALKPAHEPIVMARKPLSEKSIAENVLKHGTGGINIDGSRIEFTDNVDFNAKQNQTKNVKSNWGAYHNRGFVNDMYKSEGRFPANIIFDEEAGQLLDEQSGIGKSTPFKNNLPKISGNIYRADGETEIKKDRGYSDKGGASRFFYCPKANKNDRNEGDVSNGHPTVKPTDLMRYLINLITPTNGTVLDPFMGSGSTGKAAVRAGFNFIGIEKEQEYMDIAKARIEHEKNKPVQKDLFD